MTPEALSCAILLDQPRGKYSQTLFRVSKPGADKLYRILVFGGDLYLEPEGPVGAKKRGYFLYDHCPEYLDAYVRDVAEMSYLFGDLDPVAGKEVQASWTEYRLPGSDFGALHREDGPAIIFEHDQFWYQSGKLHRAGGPAIIEADGTKEWWLNGQRHNTAGPAVVHSDGNLEWWLNGERQPGPPPGRGSDVLKA